MNRWQHLIYQSYAMGADMEKITVQWQTDPSHGWLGVLEADVKRAGLEEADFSQYSFKDANRPMVVYWLEEDCDAGFFIRASELAGLELRYLPPKDYNFRNPIRNMERLKGESRIFNNFIKEAEKNKATL